MVGNKGACPYADYLYVLCVDYLYVLCVRWSWVNINSLCVNENFALLSLCIYQVSVDLMCCDNLLTVYSLFVQ